MANWKVAPLKSSFMLVSMLGFLISIIYSERIGEDWAFALGFVFAVMFVAAMLSMTRSPIEAQIEMAPDLVRIDKGRTKKKKAKKKKK